MTRFDIFTALSWIFLAAIVAAGFTGQLWLVALTVVGCIATSLLAGDTDADTEQDA